MLIIGLLLCNRISFSFRKYTEIQSIKQHHICDLLPNSSEKNITKCVLRGGVVHGKRERNKADEENVIKY